jgi:Tfp pilus assembly protein PilV
MARQAQSRPLLRHSDEAGFMLVEVIITCLILAIAAAGLFNAFDASRREASYSEKQDTGAVIADKELQRITALTWEGMALNSASSWKAQSASPTDPTSYLSDGPCDVSANLPAHSPCYHYDWTDASKIEPLVTAASGYDPTPNPYSFTTLAANGTTRLSGSVYRYITWVYDTNCTGENNTCGGETDYKRITVAVVVSGLKKPIVLSSLYANPIGGTTNPLAAGATCLEGGITVPCTH